MEENKNVNPAEEQAKVVVAYTVYRMSNGQTQVDNADIDGVETEKLSTNQIMTDICTVAEQIKNQREEERVYNATLRAIDAYMVAYANNQKAAEAEAQMPTDAE